MFRSRKHSGNSKATRRYIVLRATNLRILRASVFSAGLRVHLASAVAWATVAAVKPAVVSIDMGYGHLRAAYPLASKLKTEILHSDRPPLADKEEQRRWDRVRRFYDSLSRSSQRPGYRGALGAFLEAITSIPRLHPYRDLSTATLGVQSLHRLI